MKSYGISAERIEEMYDNGELPLSGLQQDYCNYIANRYKCCYATAWRMVNNWQFEYDHNLTKLRDGRPQISNTVSTNNISLDNFLYK